MQKTSYKILVIFYSHSTVCKYKHMYILVYIVYGIYVYVYVCYVDLFCWTDFMKNCVIFLWVRDIFYRSQSIVLFMALTFNLVFYLTSIQFYCFFDQLSILIPLVFPNATFSYYFIFAYQNDYHLKIWIYYTKPATEIFIFIFMALTFTLISSLR